MSKIAQSKANANELTAQNKDTPKSSKRQRRKAPETWKQNIRKTLRQSGREYVSVNGRLMTERKIHPACGGSCHLSCSTKIDIEQRQSMHNTFWKLNDEQKIYFYWKYTTRIIPKRRRKTTTNDTRRGYTIKYRFEINGDMQYVCSKFFFATLDISPRRIYYFYEHCYDKEICMPRTDALFGKGVNRKTVLTQRLDEIRNHIKTYPTESKDISNNKLYLPEGVSLENMYTSYTEDIAKPLKKLWYTKIFDKEFNLEFQTHLDVNIETQCTNRSENQNFALNEIKYGLEESTLVLAS